jgi:hypothetical protein
MKGEPIFDSERKTGILAKTLFPDLRNNSIFLTNLWNVYYTHIMRKKDVKDILSADRSIYSAAVAQHTL